MRLDPFEDISLGGFPSRVQMLSVDSGRVVSWVPFRGCSKKAKKRLGASHPCLSFGDFQNKNTQPSDSLLHPFKN